MPSDYDDEEPLAVWEAALLPDWTWEAYDKEEDDVYFGRVKSPQNYGNWEWGYFTRNQLEKAGAFRVDRDVESYEETFPDGGQTELSADIYETELEALLEEDERE
ncbi:MAG: hypothetical protein U5J64_07925 [Halobacteriales archaeon]|nr:hypothetical protein [Halobacteriales archaeon]